MKKLCTKKVEGEDGMKKRQENWSLMKMHTVFIRSSRFGMFCYLHSEIGIMAIFSPPTFDIVPREGSITLKHMLHTA